MTSLIPPPTHLLTFEINTDGQKLPDDLQLEIHMDKEGLRYFIDYLSDFLNSSKPEHAHMKTPSWAGSELSEEVQAEGDTLINHVKIMFWPNE